MVSKTKLTGRNEIVAVNTWAVAMLRYSISVIEWKREELKEMSLYGALRPKSE